MCFWKTAKEPSINIEQTKAPDLPAAPSPTPIPTPEPSVVSPQESAAQRQRKIKAMRYGAMSTIKTGGQGVTGTGPDLVSPAASALFSKSTIGS